MLFLRASPPTALRPSGTPLNVRRKLPWGKLILSSSSTVPPSSHRAASLCASASSSVHARALPADTRPAVTVKENLELVSRTELCGELGEEDVGRRVRLCGWVALHRIHDGRTFLNLRDPSGIIQITVLPDQYPDAYATANNVRTEYVVAVEGVVQPHSSESINKKMKVGNIEVTAERIQVLNSVGHQQPFYVTSADDAKERATEEFRLRYKTIVGAKQANPPIMPAVMTPGGPLDLSSVLFRNRIIFIGQPVNSQVAQRVISQLVTLASIDEDADILIYINCPGGSTYSVLAIYDTMSWIKPKVGTVCFGVAASQGALILAGGEKGMRYAMPNARIMIHQPQSGCGGHVEDVRRQVNEAVQSRYKIDKMYAAFTGQSLDKVQQYTERDRFFSSSEALDFGLIDGVLETEY